MLQNSDKKSPFRVKNSKKGIKQKWGWDGAAPDCGCEKGNGGTHNI